MKNRNPKIKTIYFLIGIGFISSISLLSCRGDGIGLTDNGTPEGKSGFAAQIQSIFDTNCVRCHEPGGLGYVQTGGSQNNGLDLTRGNSYDVMVNQPSHQLSEIEPKWRVLPGQPDSSYIMQKIISATPKFGTRMPLDGPPFLSQTDIQLIRNWIAQGAPND